MKKAIKIIEWIIFISLVAVLLILLSPFLPTKKYISSFVVVSGSMEPAVPKGSLVFTKPTQTQEVQPHDIIGFTSPENAKDMIIHRVVEYDDEQEGFITKGDNNNSEDSWRVSSMQLQGKYVYSIPYVGFATSFMKTPKGFALLIGVPALILAALQLRKIKEGIDEEVDKRTQKALEQKGFTDSIVK